MKRELVVLTGFVFLCSTISVFAQGTVTFANASTTASLPLADRNVRWGGSAQSFNPLLTPGAYVSSNFAGLNLAGLRAQLFFTTTTSTDINTFTAVSTNFNGVQTFKQSTSTTAGSWFSTTASLACTTIGTGQVLNMAVVVWDINNSSNSLSAAAKAGLWGQSSVFQYTITPNGTPAPSEFLMQNFYGLQSHGDTTR